MRQNISVIQNKFLLSSYYIYIILQGCTLVTKLATNFWAKMRAHFICNKNPKYIDQGKIDRFRVSKLYDNLKNLRWSMYKIFLVNFCMPNSSHVIYLECRSTKNYQYLKAHLPSHICQLNWWESFWTFIENYLIIQRRMYTIPSCIYFVSDV